MKTAEMLRWAGPLVERTARVLQSRESATTCQIHHPQTALPSGFALSSPPHDPTQVPVADSPVYLDGNATTPIDPQVVQSMAAYDQRSPGNPSSAHVHGARAETALRAARGEVAQLVGADPSQVIFMSGATEANNQVFHAISSKTGKQTAKPHLITSCIEHKSVLDACCRLQETLGWDVTYLPVGSDGVVRVQALEEALRPETLLVSIMLVNNEIGTRQPVWQIGRICKDRGVLFHVDAAQAVGKVHIDMRQLQADALSVSAHKFHGPKGIGALIVSPHMEQLIRQTPLLVGGGQERGLRSGTVPVPLAVGFGRASQLAREQLLHSLADAGELGKKFFHGIKKELEQGVAEICLNGSYEERVWSNVSVRIRGIDGGELLQQILPRVSCSSSSACNGAFHGSHVLEAIGVDTSRNAVLRFGLTRMTTGAEVEIAIESVVASIKKLRQL
ncbi:iscS [Symbiodinium natans]|uniref:IscS protein n=1 Tax=Symbiodinium natans TaxID=878477 RepID=A0A812TW02_9DINO|nr:iscS [Symbiodinium natans]